MYDAGGSTGSCRSIVRCELDVTDATVVICTRDRPDDLRRCLATVCAQTQGRVDVMVMHNGPDEEQVRQLVDWFPARYFQVDSPSKSHKLNRAIALCQTPVVAFLDDDECVTPHWLEDIVRHFSEPDVAYVSGCRVPLELTTTAQRVFQRRGGFSKGSRLRTFDAAYFQSVRFRGVPTYLVALGGNSAACVAAVRRIGGFDERFGPGSAIWAGESADLCYRLLRGGWKLTYDPRIVTLNRYVERYATLHQRLFFYGMSDTAVQTKFLFTFRDTRSLHEILWYKYYRQLKRIVDLLLHPKSEVTLDLILVECVGIESGIICKLGSAC